ncbi:MAG: glycosyltransferase family 1 protein [Chloroflexi bacterium]|nr:MAG: glycosyltransferase family 1 protein [Chloroflexota bacterium]
MTPKPILFVDHAAALGGAEKSLLLLMQHLDRQQWQPHLACVEGELSKAARAVNIPTHLTPLPRLRRSTSFIKNLRQAADGIAQIAKEIGAVLLHANTVRAAMVTAVTAQKTNLPCIWHMRDFWLSEAKPNRLWLDRWGKRWLCNASTAVIANSLAVATHLPCPKKVHVVHNGIDLSTFGVTPALSAAETAVSSTFRHRFNIPPDAPLIGTVGRLRPWKGQDRFIRIAAKVAKSNPSARFLIVGGSPFQVNDGFEKDLHQLAAKHNLTNRITFTGHLPDVRPALAALDIFVHAGAPEPFGLVNVEAMALGKPVVAFAHGALPEIVVHEKTGLLISSENEVKLAAAVTQLLNQPARRIEMGRNGRLHAESHFNIKRVAHEVEVIYSELFH